MTAILLKGVTPFDSSSPVDLLLEDGKIAARARALAPPEHATVIDGRGFQAFPGLVDGHAHLDKTLLGREWYINDVPRDLAAIIANERTYRHEQVPDAQLQSERIARRGIAAGTSLSVLMWILIMRLGWPIWKGCWRRADAWRSR